jgi:signal peptidase I
MITMSNELSPPPPPPAPAKRKRSEVRTIALVLLILPGLALLRQFVVQPFRIPTGAMQPTLMGTRKLPDGRQLPGDSLFVEKLSLLFRAPARGDIVVFKSKGISHPSVPPDQYYIKRVVGIPGDKILFEPPGVRVNGQRLTEPEIFRKIAARTNGHGGYCATGEYGVRSEETLRENEYFVAGDNSQNSLDSRFFGPIQRKQIIGRAWFIYAPRERIGVPE